MNTAGKKKDLALYRLQQAGESLDEAKRRSRCRNPLSRDYRTGVESTL